MADLFTCLPTEIKQVIFSHLDDKSSKNSRVSALRVNKSWFAFNVSVLWREITLHTIWYIRNSPNVDQYLSHVRSLIFGLADDRYHEEIIQILKQPRLPNLEKISYMPAVIMERTSLDYIIPYLQPSLLTFYTIGGSWSMDLLLALKDTCQHLEDLRIKWPLDSLTCHMGAEEFESWIRTFSSIRSVSIFNKGLINTSINDDMMKNLLKKPTLKYLSTKPLKRLCLEYRLDNWEYLCESPLLYTLRELSIALKPDMVTRLQDFANLEKLHIRIDGDYPEDVLSPISSMTELQSLKIIFVKPRSLRTNQIMSMKCLSKLENLEIRSGQKDSITPYPLTNYLPIKIVPIFDEEDFDELASSLPRLRHVCLLFDWDPDSCHVLRSAALHWPQIEYLCLGYNIGLFESIMVSQNGEALFPCLKQFPKARFLNADVTSIQALEPGADYTVGRAYIKSIAQNLRQGLPLLEDIIIAEDYVHQLITTMSVYTEWIPKARSWKWQCHRMDWCWDFDTYS